MRICLVWNNAGERGTQLFRVTLIDKRLLPPTQHEIVLAHCLFSGLTGERVRRQVPESSKFDHNAWLFRLMTQRQALSLEQLFQRTRAFLIIFAQNVRRVAQTLYPDALCFGCQRFKLKQRACSHICEDNAWTPQKSEIQTQTDSVRTSSQ